MDMEIFDGHRAIRWLWNYLMDKQLLDWWMGKTLDGRGLTDRRAGELLVG